MASLAELRSRPWVPRLLFVAWVLLTLVALAFLLVVIQGAMTHPDWVGYDAHAYWGYPRSPLYGEPGVSVAGIDLYRYSPAFVPLMTLFTALPWPVFVAGWIALLFVTYVWLVGPWWLPLLAFAPFLIELRMANVHLLLAAAIVLGFRWPAAWSFVLLTKVAPGIGLLWFAVRREWRSLGIALGSTAAIVGVSFVLAPQDWVDWWVSLLRTSQDDPPLSIHVPLLGRLAAAALLVVWGARTNRRWTVMVAATISLPTLWVHGFAMLAGVIALQRGLPEARSFAWLDRWLRWRPRRLASVEGSASA
jgi:hypothetical protein